MYTLKNDNILSTNQILLNESRLCSLSFNEDEVLKINKHKTHDHDCISIRMIKICDKSLLKILILWYNSSIKSSSYTEIWKSNLFNIDLNRSNIILAHKKSDKQLL